MVNGLSKWRYRRRILIQIFVAIVIFLSGIIAGSGGTIALLKSQGILQPLRRPHPPKMMASEIAKEIGSEYRLSEDQIKQIEQIFEKAGQSLEALRQDFETKMEADKQEVMAEIKAVMPPEKFEQWQQDFNARHGRRGPDADHGPGPGPGEGPDTFEHRPPANLRPHGCDAMPVRPVAKCRFFRNSLSYIEI
jgi:hypothetical protein